jgi:8-oxo-dGTP pyrophosphatase MutT (NUDIX family)
MLPGCSALFLLCCALFVSSWLSKNFCDLLILSFNQRNIMSQIEAGEFAALLRRAQERLLRPERLPLELERISQAAVTAIVRPEVNDAHVLIIKRAEHPRDPWSGHLALPGGRAAATDADLLATAVRETLEEIGLNLVAGGSFIGRLPKLSPRNPRLPQIEITPFVALAPTEVNLQFSDEVADAFWVSLRELHQTGMSSRYTLQLDGSERSWPAYPTAGGPIWGITARILNTFLTLFD